MPLRDIAVTAFVLGVLPYVFRHAWIGVMLWTWLSIMNPHRLTWGFAHNMPFAAMAAGVTLIALFTTKDRVRLPRDSAIVWLGLFIAWMCITTLFAYHFGESTKQLEKVLKIQLMVLVTLAVLHDERHIRWFVAVNALSIAFFGFKGGIYTIQTAGGGRVWGPGGFIGGNNEIGLAMLLVIPLLYFFYHESKKKWVRAGLLATMLLSAVAILGTQSRGAFLAIIAMGALLWWRAPVNKITTGAAIVAFGVLLFTFMPESWHNRMATIQNYEQDGSAMGRINAWETAINIANARPTGAGFGMYTQPVFDRYAPRPDNDRAADPSTPRAAHSIYFQILGEHGWIGLALFMALWIKAWRDAARIRKLVRERPAVQWAGHLAGMIQVSLVGYAVGGAFLSLAYFDLPYNLLIIVVLTKHLVLRKLAEPEPAAVPAGVPAALPQALGRAAPR